MHFKETIIIQYSKGQIFFHITHQFRLLNSTLGNQNS